MASTKQPYKKRVIDESDSDEDGAPLSSKLNGSTTAAHTEAVATGSVLLHNAANGDTEMASELQPQLEDAKLRHEIAAAGFPVEVTTAVSSTGAHAHHPIAAAPKNNGMMHVDGGDNSDDDDRPLSAKLNGIPKDMHKKHKKKHDKLSSRSYDSKTADKKHFHKPKNASMGASSDEDKPLASAVPKLNVNEPSKRSARASTSAASSAHNESDSEDEPLFKMTNGNGKVKKEDSDFDDDAALLAGDAKKKRKKSANDIAGKAAKPKRSKKEDSNSDADVKPRKKQKTKVKAELASSSEPSKLLADAKARAKRAKKEESADLVIIGKGKAKKEDDDEDGEGNEDDEEEDEPWWEAGDVADGPKWTTLQHNGVMFAPLYEHLPSNVKLKYKGKPVDLPPESEEVAGFFGAMLKTEHAQNPTFQANFFKDFRETLAHYPPRNKINIGENDFQHLDFTDMDTHFTAEREQKKNKSKQEKKEEKEALNKLIAPFKTAMIDGKPQTVGNFRVEPPGLFRGRGDHPKKGSLKLRLTAKDITINIGKDANVPEPPAGEQWAKVQHDPNVTWLATWKENINGNTKYVFLSADSAWKGKSDWKKFEKARKLKDIIETLRADYTNDLKSKIMADRQRATAVYFIDRFALRVGGDKDTEAEADTVGCCSLRFEHVTLQEPNLVTFDFLGKDSIRFYQPDKEVDRQVFKNLVLFKKASKPGDDLFDRINPTILNKYFQEYMPGLTAKVFRTYNASIVLQQQLATTPEDASIADKILHYNRANRLVAELCNHQRAASKTHGQTMEKLADKVKGLKYQRMKLRYTLWAVEEGNKKKHKQYLEIESDIDDEWCEKHERDLVDLQKQKVQRKFDKDNEKAKAEDKEPLDEEDLANMMAAADEMGKEIEEERRSQYVEPKKSHTTAKILDAILAMDKRIEAQKIAAVDREEGKEVSLTTSKINYMDPRITVAWCKKHEVPIEKMLTKTLRTKFTWAMKVESDWQF